MVGTGNVPALTELFTPRVFKKLGSKNDPQFLLRFSEQIGFPIDPYMPTSDFFNQVFLQIERHGYRSDFVFRNAFVQKRWLNWHSIDSVTVLNEHRAGRSRADLVLLNGLATGIEIKSDLDSLARLENQIRDYKTVFPRTLVITGSRHSAEVVRVVPKSTGVLELTKSNTLRTLVPVIEDYDTINSDAMAASMSVKEAKDLVRRSGRTLPDLPNTKIWAEIRRIFAHTDRQELCRSFSLVLKHSRSKSKYKQYLPELPRPVQTSLLLGNYRDEEWFNITKAMSGTLEE